MTRKHFEALANTLKFQHPEMTTFSATPDQVATWKLMVGAIADVCARFNHNFDRGRFLDACDPTN